ncbi:MAG TPA: glutamate racemase [Chthonomonadales bacterium]|nr:glutamate racemase [Chthonomonadales bacterium]
MTGSPGPVGVFDSGVGGLTVAAALRRRLAGEPVLYLADQAHVPYGGRPLEEVAGFARGISRYLVDARCRAIVMGCNLSSATALPEVVREMAPLPVLGVIAAAALRAAAFDPARVGVLATEGTVATGAYGRQVRAANPAAEVVEVACPAFVPLVESGCANSEEAFDHASQYLRPLADRDCRVVVLGCTHYPYLLPVLRRAASNLFAELPVFLDPADEVVGALERALPGLRRAGAAPPSRLLTTGDPARFAQQARAFWPGEPFRVGAARWTPDLRIEAVPTLAPR